MHHRSQLILLHIKKLHPTSMVRLLLELEPKLMIMSKVCANSLLRHVESSRFALSLLNLHPILRNFFSRHANAGFMPVRR